MDEIDSIHGEMSEIKKKSRNASEKKRRDAFNMLIQELRGMVTNGDRKMDKSNVLKQTIFYLKAHNQSAGGNEVKHVDHWKPSFLTNQEYACLMLDSMTAFVLVLTTGGYILFASENLIHLTRPKTNQSLKGISMFELLDSSSSMELQKLLSSEVLRAASMHNINPHNHHNGIRNIELQLRTITKKGNPSLLPIKLTGKFRRMEISNDDVDMLSHSHATNMGVALNSSNDTLCFMCVGRPILKENCASLQCELLLTGGSDKQEYTSIFNMEWKFISLDNRALAVIGYLPFEVLGTSGYDYYHPDDLSQIVEDHSELISKSQVTTKPYRFLTKGQQWLQIQSRAYITLHQWNSKPEFVVCTSWVYQDNDKPKPMITPSDITGSSSSSNATITSSTIQSYSMVRIKSEPLIKPIETPDISGKEMANPKVFRPQPGVSIKHSPIPTQTPHLRGSKRACTSPSTSTGASNEDIRKDPSAILDPMEHQIYEQLRKRQASLQQQIMQQHSELCNLQEELKKSITKPTEERAESADVPKLPANLPLNNANFVQPNSLLAPVPILGHQAIFNWPTAVPIPNRYPSPSVPYSTTSVNTASVTHLPLPNQSTHWR